MRIICSGLCRFRFIVESSRPITGLLRLSYHLDQILGSRSADLAARNRVTAEDVLEAVQYRRLDRQL